MKQRESDERGELTSDPTHVTYDEVDRMLAKSSSMTPSEVAALERFVACHESLSNVSMVGFERAWRALPRLLKERRALLAAIGARE